ncbi:hypothetical protein MF672_047510 [Actinomadura sp. ATCC 31491]|uniref:Uncharacterized protein n=1 Tax=Actinomadura luzonensis TaxID=2805427 RepID=A0ABT0GAH2_9ACTN|nr:hypothetical protein [Actinomadura luzonensis]MCK2221403.1 hypothetical protein [Actinomadura luzonensis]
MTSHRTTTGPHPSAAGDRTRAGAAFAPGLGPVIGWVDGRPVPYALLEQRVAGLRKGPLSAALPRPGTAEARQLARWQTQVILTEVLCETTAKALGLSPVDGPPLDRLAAVELGSINAAAYNGSPWVRALFEHLAAEATIPAEWRPRQSSRPSTATHFVRHRLFPDRTSAARATLHDLAPLGDVDLASLPTALAEAIAHHPEGALIGPVQDALGWHVAAATRSRQPRSPRTTESPPATHPSAQEKEGEAAQPMSNRPQRPHAAARPSPTDLLQAARRRTFARRLDELRAAKLDLVPGLEHPGDPRQPDNHHKH